MTSISDVFWSPEAIKQLEKIKKLKPDSTQYIFRIIQLIEDIQKNPFRGIGKPEHLKNKLPPCWSRRINRKDRLIYRIKNNQIEIISILGHYD